MDLIFASKTLSSTAFLFLFCAYGSLLLGSEPVLFSPYLIICFCVFLSYVLDTRIKKATRFLPFIGFAAAYFWANDMISAAIISIGVFFGAITVIKQIYITDYGVAADNFKRNIKLIVLMLVTSVVFSVFNKLGFSVLPFVVIYLITSVLELSMLRHSDETLNERRFKFLNTAFLSLTCLLGLFMSTPMFLNMTAKLLRMFLDYVVSPIMIFVVKVISYIIYGFTVFFTKIVFPEGKGNAIKMVFPELADGLVDDLTFDTWNPVLDAVGKVFLILLILAGVVYILRKSLIKGSRKNDNSGSELRETIRIRTPKNQEVQSTQSITVREVYRKFLNLMKKRGMVIEAFFTSYDINANISTEISDKAPAYELRKIYLKARYGRSDITKEELALSKELYAQMKKDK